MKSRITQKFLDDCRKLPKDVREMARSNLRRFQENPDHPELHYKHLQGTELYAIRIGAAYRALGIIIGDTFLWFWIGTHAGIVEIPYRHIGLA